MRLDIFESNNSGDCMEVKGVKTVQTGAVCVDWVVSVWGVEAMIKALIPWKILKLEEWLTMADEQNEREREKKENKKNEFYLIKLKPNTLAPILLIV